MQSSTMWDISCRDSCRHHKSIQSKAFRPVTIQQPGNTCATFSYDSPDSTQRNLQLFRFRSNRQKESPLSGTRRRRLSGNPNLVYRSTGRIRRQIQLQQLKKHFDVSHGNGQPKTALKYW